jgi:hypothetical protein
VQRLRAIGARSDDQDRSLDFVRGGGQPKRAGRSQQRQMPFAVHRRVLLVAQSFELRMRLQ